MKVCIASRATNVAGGEIAAERLAVGLREAGRDVFMLLDENDERGAVLEHMRRAGLRCRTAPLRLTDRRHWWRYLQSRAAVRRILIDERPDVVHGNDLPTHQVVSGAARGLGVARICHHRLSFDDGAAIDWFNKYGADRHVFVSRALMNATCERSPRLAASPGVVVYDGLPLPEMPSPRARLAARMRLVVPTDRLLVTFAGQITESKGVADLLRAWAMVYPRLRNGAELLMVGEDVQSAGRYRAQMELLSRDLNCGARFVGFRRDVPDWLLASDIAVVPSHAEALGNATLEAMAHALPVVACAVGGIPEMVEDEQTGLLVPPRQPPLLAAAISRLLECGELRARLGDAGRRRCERLFNLRAHVEGMLGVYRAVIDTDDAAASTVPKLQAFDVVSERSTANVAQ